jgi:hypothetical protein
MAEHFYSLLAFVYIFSVAKVLLLFFYYCTYLRSGVDRRFLPFAVSIRSMIEKVEIALEAKNAPASLESTGIKNS